MLGPTIRIEQSDRSSRPERTMDTLSGRWRLRQCRRRIESVGVETAKKAPCSTKREAELLRVRRLRHTRDPKLLCAPNEASPNTSAAAMRTNVCGCRGTTPRNWRRKCTSVARLMGMGADTRSAPIHCSTDRYVGEFLQSQRTPTGLGDDVPSDSGIKRASHHCRQQIEGGHVRKACYFQCSGRSASELLTSVGVRIPNKMAIPSACNLRASERNRL